MSLVNKKIFLFLILIFTMYCALKIGTAWDTGTHFIMGKNRLNYLFSFGNIDKELWFSKYFPGISYTITAFFVTMFPKQYEFQVLHLLNLFISISGVYGLARISKTIFNKNVAKIIFIIFLFYPTYFGHMAINPKDTVFTVSFIWISYYILKYLQKPNLYQNDRRFLFVISFLIALGTGINLVFAGVLIPLIIFVIFELLFYKKIINKKFSYKKFILDIILIILISYSILVIFWPQVHANIFTLPFLFLLETLNTPPVGSPATLLNGEIHLSNTPSKIYVLTSLILRSPEYLLILYPVSFFFILFKNSFFKKKIKNFNYKIYFVLKTLVIFLIILTVSPFPLYDGMRKFMFIIPYFVIIPGLGIYYILSNLHLISNKILFSLLGVLGLVFLFKFFSLTPYQYVYLNYLNGKTSNNFTKFENDYLATSMKELFEKSKFPKNQVIKLNYCGVGEGKIRRYLKEYKLSNVKLTKDEKEFDFIIMTNRVNWDSINWKDPNPLDKAKSCFQSFDGKLISSVSRNGLKLSMIREN